MPTKRLALTILSLTLFSSIQVHAYPQATNVNILHSFSSATEGRTPNTTMVISTDGKYLYGSTSYGKIFRVTLDGTPKPPLSIIHNTSDIVLYGNMTLSKDGKYLYGITASQSGGTVFRITLDGTDKPPYDVIHTFDIKKYEEGADPIGDLILSDDGKTIYGITESGGTGGAARAKGGVIYKLTFDSSSAATFSILHSFTGKDDGGGAFAGMIMSPDGKFLYGSTDSGGFLNGGTVFKFALDGTKEFTLLHYFDPNVEGSSPDTRLVIGKDGALYGTTVWGGAHGDGTIYKIIPETSDFSLVHTFEREEGAHPTSNLVLSAEGDAVYGTTDVGGCVGKVCKQGTVFKIMLDDGDLNTLYTFGSGTQSPDGNQPEGGLVQGKDARTFYGTTYFGGMNDDGTIYQLNLP